ncbi:hypothetical protein M9Y10_037637 [Tritrichomonas musculus]|uniref:Uncharacterized protein n=1 Tax=Tritrichomonas musculus TaxID=1915356 RepID=A0ABR2GRZ2_9EUKA
MSYFLPIQCTFRLSRAFDAKEMKKHFNFLFQDPKTYGEWNMKGVILEPKYMYEPQPFSCVENFCLAFGEHLGKIRRIWPNCKGYLIGKLGDMQNGHFVPLEGNHSFQKISIPRGGINSKPYNALIRKVRKGSKNPIKEWNETSKRYNKYDEEREEEHRKWREEEEQRKQRDFDATMEVNDGVADYETPFYDEPPKRSKKKKSKKQKVAYENEFDDPNYYENSGVAEEVPFYD